MSFVQVLLAGGLGNRMFEYAFARGYAERHGLELRRETCILDQIFDIPACPPVDGSVSQVVSAENVKTEDNGQPGWAGRTGVTIVGMGQHQDCLDYYTRAKAREWFKLRPELEELVKDVPILNLVANPREGDYAFACNPMVLIDRQAYIAACEEQGYDSLWLYFLDGETHWRIPGIPVEKPWGQLNDEEKGKLPGTKARLDFLPDWAILLRAKILFRSNSTFSWWGAALGEHDKVFCPNVARVRPEDGILPNNPTRKPQIVPFVEGNHLPMIAGYPWATELHLKEQ